MLQLIGYFSMRVIHNEQLEDVSIALILSAYLMMQSWVCYVEF